MTVPQPEAHSADDLESMLRDVARPVDRLRAVAVAVIAAARAAGLDDLVVTGGTAVALVTTLDFGTRDIDLVTRSGKELDPVLRRLGFDRGHGDHWSHRSLEFLVESPASALPEGSAVDTVQLDGLAVDIWSVTDLIVDRVARQPFTVRSSGSSRPPSFEPSPGPGTSPSEPDGEPPTTGCRTAWPPSSRSSSPSRMDLCRTTTFATPSESPCGGGNLRA